MKINRPLYLALKFLTGRKQLLNNRNLIGAVLGIGMALVPLIVVLEISSGMIEGITRRYMEVGSYHLQIKRYDDPNRAALTETIEEIKGMENVRSAYAVTTGLGIAYSEDGRSGINFKALPPEYLLIDKGASDYLEIVEGNFDLAAKDSAMLSTEVARILEVKTGDRIKILTARKLPGRRAVLKPSYLTVKGIFSTGYYELDALSIYINNEKGMSLFKDRGDTFIAVKLKDPFKDIEKQTVEMRKKLNSGFMVYNWYDLERNMIESFNTTKTILLFIMIIIVLVAAINISSSVIMLVIEKETEIAMLMSTGVSGVLIGRSFIFTGLILGTVGTILGLIAGLGIAVNINGIVNILEITVNSLYSFLRVFLNPIAGIKERGFVLIDTSYYLEKIPVNIGLKDILIISALTLLLSAGASYFPARKAGRLKPMDILRKH